MSLLFNMLSRLVMTFLPRSKRLLILWLQSTSALILEPPKIKSDTVYTVSLGLFNTDQFSSVTQSCPTPYDPMDCSLPELPVHHQLPEFTQTHVHWVGNAIQPSHCLSFPSPPTFNLSQHQGLHKRVSSSHTVAKVLEFQLQHQSFQWIFRIDFF